MQIYCSALVFSPKASKIRSLFESHMPRWVSQHPVVERDWTSELSVLEGHTHVQTVAFSPTENLVFSLTYDAIASLWDYITGTERFRFDDGKIHHCVAFSPDGKSIALGSYYGFVTVKEFGQGSSIDLKGHNANVFHVVFSPKRGRMLASTSRDDTVRIWNLDERQTTHILYHPAGCEPYVAEFTPDGRFLLVGSTMSLKMWDVENGECVRTFDDVDTENVQKIAIFTDGEKAALAQESQKVFLFNLSTGKRLFEASYDRSIASISLLPPDEQMMLVATVMGSVEIRDVNTWSIVRQFKISHNDSCFAVSRDGELLVTGGLNDNLRLSELSLSAIGNTAPERTHRFGDHIKFSPDDSLVLRDDFGRSASMWDVADGRMRSLPVDSVKQVNFSPDGRYFVLKLDEESCQLWTASLATRILESKRLSNIVFSPDSSFMALLHIDGKVQAVDSTTFQEMMTWEISDMTKIAFSPNSQVVVLSDPGNKTGEPTFELWDLPRRKLLWRTSKSYSPSDQHWQWCPAHVELSPNGQVAAYQWEDMRNHTEWEWNLLEVVTGKEEKVHCDGQLAVYHPDSRLIALETHDDSEGFSCSLITLYETASFEPTHNIRLGWPGNKQRTLKTMAISTTGKLVAASTGERGDMTVQMWGTTSGMEIGRYTVEEPGYMSNLSFLDDRYLSCDQGWLPIPFSLPNQETRGSEERRQASQHSLLVRSQWVYKDFERILWLPPAYRSSASVLRGQTLALAHESGAVRIVKFNLTETPVSNAQQPEVHLLS